MTSVTQSTTSTVVAVLGTINSSAMSIAKVIDSAASAVDMLDMYVQKAKRQQIERHTVDSHDYRFTLLSEAANAKRKLVTSIEKELANDVNGQQKFNTYFAEYEALFAPAVQP